MTEHPVLCGCYRADKLSDFMRELPILKRSYPTFSLSLVCKDLGVAHNGNPKTNLLLKMIDTGEILLARGKSYIKINACDCEVGERTRLLFIPFTLNEMYLLSGKPYLIFEE